MPHNELLEASLRGDRIFGVILPYNSLPAMSLEVIRVEQDSVVVKHWSSFFRVRAGDPRFAFWAVRFDQVCTEYRRAGWGPVFDVLDDPEEREAAKIQSEEQIAVFGCRREAAKTGSPIVDVQYAISHFSDNFSNTVLFHRKDGSQHIINGYCYRNPNSPKGEP